MKKLIVKVVFLIIVAFGVNVQNGQGQAVVWQGDTVYMEKSDKTLEYFGSLIKENETTTFKLVDYSLSWVFKDDVLMVKCKEGKGGIPDYSYRYTSIVTPYYVGLPANFSPAYKLPSSITSLIIEDGITRIGDAAFLGCSNLTAVTIPESVTSIGDFAFYECVNLTAVTIPHNVKYLNGVFRACKKLTVVEVKNPVPPIGYPFSKISLKNVKLIVPAGTKTTYAKTKGWKKFGIIEESVVKE